MAKLSFLLLIVTTISIVLTYWSCRLLNLENNQSRLHWPIGLTMIAVATIAKPVFIVHLLMNLVGGCLLGFSLLWDESTMDANHGIDSSKQISSVFWSLVLLCLGGVVVLVRVPSIFDYGLRWDEHWHLTTFLGYFKEGRYTTWNFRRGVPTEGSYLRAWLYTWQVAQFTRWFRNPLYSARVVSLIWGVMALVPFYLLFRRMRVDQLLMMLGITWFAFSPQLITVSRWGRFYSFFLFTYLFLVYCLFEFLLADDFLPRILYGVLTVGLFVLGSHLNPLTFLIIPAIYGFLAYEILATCNLSFPLPEFRLDHVLAISAGMSMLILPAFFYF